MTTYRAYFHAPHAYAVEVIEAMTPKQALNKARAFYDRHMIALDWCPYDLDCKPLQEIIITGTDNAVTQWRSDDLLLEFAASDLFDALKDLVERDRAEAAECGFSDDEMAWLDDARRALAKAKGGAK